MRRNWALPRLLLAIADCNHFNRSNLVSFVVDGSERNYANKSKDGVHSERSKIDSRFTLNVSLNTVDVRSNY